MLKPVAAVRDAILECCDVGNITLEVISNVFTGVTPVDKIIYAPYDTKPENPIWGEFTRWSQQPGVYQGFESIVEVRYPKHLLRAEMVAWRRFIVCKELCHSLYADQGKHDVSQAAMDKTVAEFSLWSAGKSGKPEDWGYGITIEIVATLGAMELLLPLASRERIVEDQGQPDQAAILALAREHLIPESYLEMSFQSDTMRIFGALLVA